MMIKSENNELPDRLEENYADNENDCNECSLTYNKDWATCYLNHSSQKTAIILFAINMSK